MNKKLNIVFNVILLLLIISLLSVIVFPKLNKIIEDSKLEVFTAQLQEIYRVSKTKYSNYSNVTYNNGIGASTTNYNCNVLDDLTLNDKKMIYTITLDTSGNVINFAVTNGKYEYEYEGNGLDFNELKESNVANIKVVNSKISLSLCE